MTQNMAPVGWAMGADLYTGWPGFSTSSSDKKVERSLKKGIRTQEHVRMAFGSKRSHDEVFRRRVLNAYLDTKFWQNEDRGKLVRKLNRLECHPTITSSATPETCLTIQYPQFRETFAAVRNAWDLPDSTVLPPRKKPSETAGAEDDTATPTMPEHAHGGGAETPAFDLHKFPGVPKTVPESLHRRSLSISTASTSTGSDLSSPATRHAAMLSVLDIHRALAETSLDGGPEEEVLPEEEGEESDDVGEFDSEDDQPPPSLVSDKRSSMHTSAPASVYLGSASNLSTLTVTGATVVTTTVSVRSSVSAPSSPPSGTTTPPPPSSLQAPLALRDAAAAATGATVDAKHLSALGFALDSRPRRASLRPLGKRLVVHRITHSPREEVAVSGEGDPMLSPRLPSTPESAREARERERADREDQWRRVKDENAAATAERTPRPPSWLKDD
ncbi:uncharacterized protein LOC62_05G007623 [Vanrija pseudolonga]|uniref:Uncharacterized protein n=1 Tax=Vanrija pseudolonga TaxID=143232 RepID=A0AAF1BK05_9TREE|nr:hypothetical protein LOC62_05G007623 [Vanrija pseudolonga]